MDGYREPPPDPLEGRQNKNNPIGLDWLSPMVACIRLASLDLG